MFNTKKIISIIILIIVLIILFFVGSSANSKKSDKFIGTIKSVRDNTMVVVGSFENEKSLLSPQYEYTLKVGAGSKIVKNSFELPKGGQMFEMDKLPKETTNVDYATLEKDSQNVALGVEVTLSRNFLGAVQKKAKQITYIGPKY